MKKTYFLIFISLCLLVASCSKSPVNKPQTFPASALYGRWLITKKHYRIYAIPSSFNPSTDHLVKDTLFKDTTFNVDLGNPDKIRYAIFNSDGTVALTNFFFHFVNEPPRKGDTLYLTYQKVNDKINYYLPNNSSTIVHANTVLSVKETSLELEWSFVSPILDFSFPGINRTKYYYQFEDDFYTRQ